MEPVNDGLILKSSGQVDLGVLHVTLVDGESIIGHVWKDETTYTVEHPVFPNLQSNPGTGKLSVALLPLRPYLKKNVAKITLLDSHVVYTAPVSKEMEKLYQQFTSDIVIADMADVNLSSIIK